jgi:hypothetical protein
MTALLEQFYGRGKAREADLAGNFERFIGLLEGRRKKRKPIVIVIDGRETGVGKSSLGMQICQRMFPSFGLDHVTFSGSELHRKYAIAKPGTMILYDEAALGLLSRRGSRDEETSSLIGALSIVRKNQVGTVLCVPKKEMLDSIVLNGLAPYWIFVEDRGRARPHRAHRGARYRRSQQFVAYDLMKRIHPIGFRNLDRTKLFQQYNEFAIEKNREWFRLHAIDPSGRLKQCPGCRRFGSGYWLATHVCPAGWSPEDGLDAPRGGDGHDRVDGGPPASRPPGLDENVPFRSQQPTAGPPAIPGVDADHRACPHCGHVIHSSGMAKHIRRRHWDNGRGAASAPPPAPPAVPPGVPAGG